MNKPVYTVNSRIGFGKYNKRLVSDILKSDAKYLKWAWVERRLFDVDKNLYQLLSKVQSDITGLKLPPPVDTKLEHIVSEIVKEMRLKKAEPRYTVDEFFEEIWDNDDYVDVQGSYMEMAIDNLITDIEERIKTIPEVNQDVARQAIKDLWIEKIKMWSKTII
jgi:hypothetical protein